MNNHGFFILQVSFVRFKKRICRYPPPNGRGLTNELGI